MSTEATDDSRQKQKVPAGPKSSRDKLGGGRSPHALSRCNHLAPAVRVDRSPTPFSVTRGVTGLIAGPFKASRHMNYWVRFICPLQPVVAATDLRTKPGRGSEPFPSGPSGTGLPPLLAVRWPVPRVSPLIPQVTLSFTWQRCIFCIAADPDSFHDCCLEFVAIPTGTPALSLLSEDFVWLAVSGQFWISAVLILQ